MASFNRSLFEWLFQFSHAHVILENLIILSAVYLPYVLGIGALFLIASERHWQRRLFFFSEVVLGLILSRGIITEAIRFFFPHPRPFDAYEIVALIAESGHSFPSGHAAFFFALATTLFYYNRRWGLWYFLLTLIIGAARIFAGVHWPLDIMGGAATGMLSAIAVHLLLTPSFKKLFIPHTPMLSRSEK